MRRTKIKYYLRICKYSLIKLMITDNKNSIYVRFHSQFLKMSSLGALINDRVFVISMCDSFLWGIYRCCMFTTFIMANTMQYFKLLLTITFKYRIFDNIWDVFKIFITFVVIYLIFETYGIAIIGSIYLIILTPFCWKKFIVGLSDVHVVARCGFRSWWFCKKKNSMVGYLFC